MSQPAAQPVYSPPSVVPLSRAPHAAPDPYAVDPFALTEQPAVEPFPAQALHACRVLAHVLQRVPRPESVQLFTADHWSAPWLQVHLYPDPDDAQLAAYQHALGGRLTRSRSESEARSVVYSELATVVDRVRIQVWNVNESPLPTRYPADAVTADAAFTDAAPAEAPTTDAPSADVPASGEPATDEPGSDAAGPDAAPDAASPDVDANDGSEPDRDPAPAVATAADASAPADPSADAATTTADAATTADGPQDAS